jgi:hypothetical protein
MEETIMDTETPKRDPILERAWKNYASLDRAADKRAKGFYNIRSWIVWLGILATLFAILTQQVFPEPLNTLNPPFAYYATLGLGVKVLFVALPILASALAALATRLYSNGSWLIYRAGAEEVKKEIYIYRAILPKDTARRDYLEKRLGEIQGKVLHNLGGKKFAFEGYKGSLPSNYNRKKTDSDPGFHDLTGEEYVRYRLKTQLEWHNSRVNQRKSERRWMAIYVLSVGGLAALLAALGGLFGIWVALAASVTAALLAWQELRSVDAIIKNYSKVVVKLSGLYNHWQLLETDERTTAEFEKMVLGCEHVLWTQNGEYIRSMQEALNQADLEKEAALIHEMIKETADSAERAKEKMRENIIETAEEFWADTEQRMREELKQVLGTLAEQASREVVQKELESMSNVLKSAGDLLEEVYFTSIYPKEGQVETWHTLLVYAHVPSAMDALRRDAQRFAGQIPWPKEISVPASTRLARGTELTIVPSCEKVTFNPERLVLKWMEDYQRAEFRFRADSVLADDAARGQINIYAGPLLVGTLTFAMLFSKTAPNVVPPQEENSRMYRQEEIFVSYSHQDTAVALACKKAYEALGFNVLIDVDTLRAGQLWNEKLMNMIDRASIFQLFWSPNSGQSKYCRQEWEHALKRNREGFIRPVYWEHPMFKPPEELSKYHFEYMEVETPSAPNG